MDAKPTLMLDGRAIVVTGATSGIGHATACRFVEEGARVLAVGRNEAALGELAARFSRGPGRVETLAVDLRQAGAPEQIVQAARSTIGGIDALVNAAGIIGFGTVADTTDERWQEMLEINLDAPFRLIRAAVPHLAARRGSVVNVSSVAGLRSFPGLLAYSVSKAAVDQLTRCAALELAPQGIRVNAVNPGVVVTELHRRAGLSEPAYAAFLERSRETHPLGRTGRAEEVAELILYLVSERSAWITGETLAIDGGRHLTCAR